jgi:hypothetical protein
LRKLAPAVLAVTVLGPLYLETLVRRTVASRPAAGLAAVAVIVLVALAVARPVTAEAVPSLATVDPPAAAFREIETGHALDEPVTVAFTTPMDPASVGESLRILPAAAAALSWDPTATTLLVTPVEGWAPGTLYTITIDATAHDREGRSLDGPVRASFVSRAAAQARIVADKVVDDRAAVTTGFVLTFDQPVDAASVRDSFTVDPPVEGSFDRLTPRQPVTRMVFRPDAALEAGTSYQVALETPTDADGASVGPVQLAVETVDAPSVVRFRPRAGTEDVARDATISVRFTEPMARGSAKKAFSVTVDGKVVDGKVTFAEDDTVLVFDPANELPYGSEVSMAVADTALSAGGAPVTKSVAATFTTEPKPTPKPASTPRPASSSSSGGRSTRVTRPASASWIAAEEYLIDLMNCTRGGGWVEANGSCSSPGGSSRQPLRYDSGISDRVARPYAKLLVSSGVCSHFYGGSPRDRLRAAGYTSYTWGENLGCRYYSDPRDAAIGLVRFFQSEKSWNGGHWRNMMDPDFDRAGVGFWVSGGTLRFVVDYYHP